MPKTKSKAATANTQAVVGNDESEVKFRDYASKDFGTSLQQTSD